jgi:glycosyltransferase involved in cell wall biosynthesis
VTCTGANQAYLQDIGGPELADKVELGYHGVDVDKFAQRLDEPSGDVPVILSVGRLVQKKGFADLIDALAILKDRGTPFRTLIVGGGPERANLKAQIERLGLDAHVSLLGTVSQETLVGIYKEATLFTLACRILDDGDRDGIPNVLMESMSTGLPVVTTPISGIPEVIRSGENGLLVPERDVSALASALDLLLHDAGLRQRLGAAARATMVSEMSAGAMAQKLAGLFFGAIGRPAPTPAETA